MKINAPTWQVNSTENLYKNFKHNFEIQNDQSNKLNNSANAIQNEDQGLNQTQSVLSDKEMDVLQLLFGEDQKNNMNHFYGHHQPKNVSSGYFLDVKG